MDSFRLAAHRRKKSSQRCAKSNLHAGRTEEFEHRSQPAQAAHWIEVGRAMGMKPQQLFFRITLPLALPVIDAGIRITTVTKVGIAGLASLVGQSGLGDLIFQNIVSFDIDAVVAGAILIAFFAIAADLLLLALQIGLNRGRSALSVE